jgi:hypothetical protein
MALVPNSALAQAGGYQDQIVAELRVDGFDPTFRQDYRVFLAAHPSAPYSSSGGYTTNWLGLHLAADPHFEFIQVGLKADQNGTHWFAQAWEFVPGAGSPITCLRGERSEPDGDGVYHGCTGAVGDIVASDQWSSVELVTYGQGFWIARVYTPSGSAVDVAKFSSGNTSIQRALVSTEETRLESADPFLGSAFYHCHPQVLGGDGGWQEWPYSTQGHPNYLYATNESGYNSFCPLNYGANLYLADDPRFWFAGTGGQKCDEHIFPPPWDVNWDHVISVLDLTSVSGHWGETGPHCWIPADVNCDGVISLLDLTVIGAHMGETW